jgi:hypothetical protein
MDVNPGRIVSGGLSSIQLSDDIRLVLRPGAVLTTQQAPISLFTEVVSPFLNPVSFTVAVESQASSGTIQQSIALQKDDGTYQTFDTSACTLSDGTVTVNVNSNVADFVRPDGTIRARINYKAGGPVISYPWEARVDHVLFSIQR